MQVTWSIVWGVQMLAGIETFPNVNRGSAIVETALREGHGICIGARRQIGLQGEPHQTLWVCSHHLLLRFAIPHLLSGFCVVCQPSTLCLGFVTPCLLLTSYREEGASRAA